MGQKIPIRKFSFRIIVFSVIVAGLAALFQWLFPAISTPAMPFIVLFFFVITLLTIYVILRRDGVGNDRQFLSGYMLSRSIKIFSCLIFVALYIFLNKPDAVKFAIAFMVIYFLYAIFEVILLKKENDDIQEMINSNKQDNINKKD